MSAREFRDDDRGYVAWIAAHPSGYVINIRRGHNPTDARLHIAGCRWISGENQRGGPWTGPYVKVCADELADLEQWATNHAGGPIRWCATCHPARDSSAGPTAGVPAMQAQAKTRGGAQVDARSHVRGPESDQPVVEAWADDYVHFQNRPAWQNELRNQILGRVGQLVATVDDVLHATFFGRLPARTDVENLLLYNFGSFASATRFGVRFELGGAVPAGPDGSDYGYAYRYELAPRAGGYGTWREARALASIEWIDLGPLSGDKICEQVWLALARAEVAVSGEPREPSTPFSAQFMIQPPVGQTRGVAGLVKGIFDGAISALQAHTDASDLAELTMRAAKHIPATPAEIASLLTRRDRAVLGAVPSLVHRRGAGVQWSPADDFCVAGELLAAPPSSSRWAIKGEIVEVARSD